jgi:general secretion pathway protein B
MSFILDALKKAESERNRSAGPVLMDVRVLQSRQRLPAWAWVLAAVLLANLLLLGWLLLRKDEPAPALAAETALPSTASPPAAGTPPPAVAAVVPPPITAAELPRALPPAVLREQPTPSGSAESGPALAPQMDRPARPAAAATPPAPRIDNLPTARDLVAQGVSLPALQIQLLAYDEVPADRFVLLDGRRLREGDEVGDGIRVESIVPGGVVLNARGRRFVVLAGS